MASLPAAPPQDVSGEAAWLLTWLVEEGFGRTQPRSFARAKALLESLIARRDHSTVMPEDFG